MTRQCHSVQTLLTSKPIAQALNLRLHTEAYAVLGFVKLHQGCDDEAKAIWRSVLPRLRVALAGEVTPPPDSLVNYLTMASLSEQFTSGDGDLILSKLVGHGPSDSLVSLVRLSTGPDVLTTALRDMWRSPRGRQCAEGIALQAIAYSDLARLPPRGKECRTGWAGDPWRRH